MFCSECGNQIPEGSKFCFKCRASLTALTAVARGPANSGPEHRAGQDQPQPQASLSGVSASASAQTGATPDPERTGWPDSSNHHRVEVGRAPDRLGSRSDSHLSTAANASRRRMANHVNVLAYSALAVAVLFLIASVLEIVPKSPTPGMYQPSGMLAANPAMAIMTLILFVVPCLVIFVGLKLLKPWGRTISLGFAILTMAVPVSWYAWWVLSQEETRRLFGVANRGQTAFSRSPLRTAGYGVFIAIAVLMNIGLISAIVKDISGPSSTRIIPIADVASAIGSDGGYCGMDEFGKLTGGRPVNIEGTVTRVDNSSGTRTYLLEDTTSGVTVIVNRQFPPPANNEKIRVMGIVQCPPVGALAGKLMHEVLRMPARSTN